jgi:CRISPR-associated protein Cas2
MLMVVSYDVATTSANGRRRLRWVARECQNFGQRVQDSVFECIVDPAQWTQLRFRLLDLYDPDEDSLRFYRLGSNWQGRVEHHGAKKPLDLGGPLVL